MFWCRDGRCPRPVSLPVRIRSWTRACARWRAFEKGELPAAGVGGERLVAVAVADLARVQGGPGVREFAADDDPHAGAGLGPLAQVEHAGDLDDVGVLTQVPVGVRRCLPGQAGASLIAVRMAWVTG